MSKRSVGTAMPPGIARAALEEFRENGYDRATVRGIAARAGVPISTLYTHIDSKQELFLALVEPVIERASTRIAAVAASDRPPREKLRAAIVSATSAFDEHHPELFVYLRDFYPVLERADPEARRRYERVWVELIEAGERAGDLRPGADPKLLAYGILGMVSWMHHWYRPDGARTAAEIGEQFAAMVIDGLAR